MSPMPTPNGQPTPSDLCGQILQCGAAVLGRSLLGRSAPSQIGVSRGCIGAARPSKMWGTTTATLIRRGLLGTAAAAAAAAAAHRNNHRSQEFASLPTCSTYALLVRMGQAGKFGHSSPGGWNCALLVLIHSVRAFRRTAFLVCPVCLLGFGRRVCVLARIRAWCKLMSFGR